MMTEIENHHSDIIVDILQRVCSAKYMYETHIIHGQKELTHPSSLSSQLYQAHQ